MGSSVDNAGIIATPNGQTMLAAGHDFVLRQGFGTDANQTSTTRGNEISTGSWDGSNWTNGGGAVSNAGLIFSQQGDITLAGHSIAQNGILLSTTSVNTRGTIHLLNAASDTTGSITLGSNSITDVMLELDSDATALNSQRDALIAASSAANVQRAAAATGAFNNLSLLADRQDESRIEIVTGGTVTFKNGSITLAQGGQVAASAGQRIFTESGSTIDVSGVRDVLLPMSANNIEVNVQGNELRDSPANRDNGFLANSDVWIDVRDLIFVPAGTGGYASDRYYTPGGLLEVSGYLANTAHKIGEWASVGGTITLSAPEVIAQKGSVFDISGGSIRYDSGNITTTNFLGSDGRLYNINDARADMTFVGLSEGFVIRNERWGITAVWTSPFNRGRTSTQWEDGYTVGRDAGQLILSTPTSVFEGTILADVVTGTRQINARPEGVTDGYKLAQNTAALAGSLALGTYDATGLIGGVDASVVFGRGAASVTDGMSASDTLPSDRSHTAYFDADLISSFGIGGANIASKDSVIVDAPVSFAAGAQVTFAAPYVNINADITAHGGAVTLGNLIHSPPIPGQNIVWTALTDTDGKAQVTINAAIDLTGFWTNNSSNNSSDTSGLAYLDGGNLTVSTTGGITLAGGSIVDVSSGGSILANRKTQGGKGGSVSLLTNDYSHFADTGLIGIDFSAQLVLDGSIRSYGFNGGGTLTLGAGQSVVIGHNAAGVTDPVLVISPDLFQSGFTSYDIRSFAGMTIADGTAISPVVPIYQFTNASYSAPTGTNAANAASLWTPPTYLDNPAAGKLTQRVGADLTLSSLYDFNMKSGSAITVDPGHNVTIYANRQTTIDGRITAPGGNILVTSLQDVVYNGGQGLYAPTRSIWIGDDATLDVSARAVTGINAQGMTYGVVPDGGSITLGGTGAKDGDGYLIASDTFVIVRPGALLDASGTSAVLDITSRGGTVPTQVASDGGTIALYSALGLYIDGTLRAASGGAGASGGTLILANVGHQYSPIPAGPNSPYGIGDIPAEMQKLRNITITQHQQQSGLASNLAPGQADPTLQIGNAAISVDQIHAGGFDALSLYTRDLFVFQGNVDLAMNRSITLSGGILSAAASTPHIAVNLSAPYVNLTGWNDLNTIVQAYYPGLNAVKGPSLNNADDSTFNVSANLIDISGKLYFGVHGHQGSGVVSAIDINHTVLDDTTDDNTHISGGDIIDAAGFKHVTLHSAGDVRFGSSTTTTPGDLTIQAAQLYPLSNASAMVNVGVVLPLNASGGIGIASTDLDTALTIRSNGGPAPDVPPSVFGKLVLLSAMIDQGGVVRAPLGSVFAQQQ